MSKKFHAASAAIRRAASEGSDTHKVASQRFVDPRDQVTDRSTVQIFCNEMLAGNVGHYPIFGTDLRVETRGQPDSEFSAVVFHGAVDRHPLNYVLRSGVWVNVNNLFRDSSKPQTWKHSSAEGLARFLWAQPAIQSALQAIQKEHKASMSKSDAVAPKPENCVAKELVAIPFGPKMRTADVGYFRHDSGVVLELYKGRYDNVQIWIVECPKDHELYQVKKARAFVHLKHVLEFPAELPGVLTGILGYAQQLRVWLRQEFRAVGAMPPVEDTSATADGLATLPALTNELTEA